MKPTIVLPSYNPDEKLIQVVDGLVKNGFERIIVVNDGSQKCCDAIFHKVECYPQCTVLVHEVNHGKGRALKTAFAHLLQENCHGVITVDGDNQHQLEDIAKVALAMEQHPESLVLGCRNFDSENVPARSASGNKMTALAFRLFFGLTISDTQTGLRGIPYRALASFCHLEGERFEYETNMLLACKKNKLSIVEVKIQTIYINENETSHFRPLIDSLKILQLMFKFMVSSIGCAALDLLLYWVIYRLLGDASLSSAVFIATAVARVASSMVNYGLNRTAVFASSSDFKGSVVRYYFLAAAQMFCSYLGVYLLTAAFGNSILMKLAVDILLFLVSFRIQQRWVFQP